MNNTTTKTLSHAVYSIRLHLVLVTKYRRKVITKPMLDYLRPAFAKVLEDWRCSLIEFNGEADHVHVLIEIHPALTISSLINNLKTATSRRVRAEFKEQVAKFYLKPVFWHRAYFVGSVGDTSLETIKKIHRIPSPTNKVRAARPPLD